MTDSNERNLADERPDPDTTVDGGDPPPASEDTPDGQFDDQDMPTTDGEPAELDPHPEPPD